MNKDLYDPTGKPPAKVTHYLTQLVAKEAMASADADAAASVAKQRMYDVMEAAHATGHSQRKMGLLTAPQLAEASGLSLKRIEQILKDARERRNEDRREAAERRKAQDAADAAPTPA